MAFTKKTAKGRLDKYYHLAKEQGYRARSAFKLIQLNQKFNFLESARVLVDLCAAPGGWLQVASKYMPMSKVIVGVDLASIKPLPGVTTLIGDITTAECRRNLQASLSGWKADVVLHDGAPNVGASWDHDAYAQAELVLHSLRLATEILRPGGLFVTKVFRSKDYNALLFVFNALFRNVEATKPASSRGVSAEIFVVCKDFIAPKKIDPRLLDPKAVFEVTSHLQLDGGRAASENSKVNILRPEKQTRHRGGYEDDASTMLYKEIALEAFIVASDPAELLSSANAILLPLPESKHAAQNSEASLFSQQLSDILYSHPKANPSPDIIASCTDLKVLGRREFHELLKWRLVLRRQMKKFLPGSAKSEPSELGYTEILNENALKVQDSDGSKIQNEEEEQDLSKETTRLISVEAKRAKKIKKKALLKKAKTREKLHLGLAEDASLIDAHDQELFSFMGSSSASLDGKSMMARGEDGETQEESLADEPEESSISGDEFDLEGQLEQLYARYKERSAGLASHNLDELENSQSENIAPWAGYFSSQNSMETPLHQFTDEDSSEEGPDPIGGNQSGLPKRIDLLFARSTFKAFNSASEDEADPEPSGRRASASNQKRPLKNKATAPSDTTIEFVKAVEPFLSRKRQADPEVGSEDELNGPGSENYKKILSTPRGLSLALALRSHTDEDDPHGASGSHKSIAAKDAMRDASFNRYAFDDRHANLPSWFMEDESRHNVPQVPVTAETIQAAKSHLKTLAARIPKKELEAKARARSRALRRLTAQQAKAGSIAASEEMSESQKSTALAKMRPQSLNSRSSRKKNIVVARGANKGAKGRPRGVKGRYKMVDARMKKETRADRKKKRSSRR
ncbi:AdoMet-dependent rRNA methyltransferase spb1 [Mitosporidium daphniae]|uniref:rRNA methyltransferase Spb1 n=1 Tax=Mitosporidium daphniae TaxID=1485682 RepID=A0A098VQC6_9MICR|nr:rRNA methyltransferase Spb1 [Mitosporidium daphniae]KGG51190.1 rRNA methyltransferase Spb1 [Mitosporidium daphniae]|eukprot:XP_013237639.1 rRNA methyltransferase Spb1 [Mitosporidium daphniae]